MSGITDVNNASVRDNSLVEVIGGTDGTAIGNTGDRFKVDIGTTGTVVLNEPATFIVEADGVAIGNNKSMFSILNGGGSSVLIKVRRIYLVNDQTTAVTGVISSFSLLRITGHSAGTSLTPLPLDTSDSLNGSVTARHSATIAGEAATALRIAKWSSDEWGSGSSDVESFDHTNQELIPWIEHKEGTKPITLRAGEGVHIKHTVNSTAGSFKTVVVFTQESA
jgi:hypothetical protein